VSVNINQFICCSEFHHYYQPRINTILSICQGHSYDLLFSARDTSYYCYVSIQSPAFNLIYHWHSATKSISEPIVFPLLSTLTNCLKACLFLLKFD